MGPNHFIHYSTISRKSQAARAADIESLTAGIVETIPVFLFKVYPTRGRRKEAM